MLMPIMEVVESLTSELQVGQQARSVGVCEKRGAAGQQTPTRHSDRHSSR